jgi:hypothetical protein
MMIGIADGDGSGGDASGGGGSEAEAAVNSGTMRAAVLEALSDPAVVRQLAVAVSASSSSSAPALASAHEGMSGTIGVDFINLGYNISVY